VYLTPALDANVAPCGSRRTLSRLAQDALGYQHTVDVNLLAVDIFVAQVDATNVITATAVDIVVCVTVVGIDSIVPFLTIQEIVVISKGVGAYGVWALSRVDRVARGIAGALKDRVGTCSTVSRPIGTREVARERDSGKKHRQKRHRPDEDRYLAHVYPLPSSWRRVILAALTALHTLLHQNYVPRNTIRINSPDFAKAFFVVLRGAQFQCPPEHICLSSPPLIEHLSCLGAPRPSSALVCLPIYTANCATVLLAAHHANCVFLVSTRILSCRQSAHPCPPASRPRALAKKASSVPDSLVINVPRTTVR